MRQLNRKVENQRLISIGDLAYDLGCTTQKLRKWLRNQDEVTLRKTSSEEVKVDPLELRRCLSKKSDNRIQD